ncbi:hypothetical protein MTR_2g007440 [Medicago truncatula]|uniref:Uncharacterized protein n=1 Tax=Medicago truncatula TaxID=3880 RepID=G7IJX9_MEDTR|nr:hypothetical protein MTR_2g007440 [Medicago truncatula]
MEAMDFNGYSGNTKSKFIANALFEMGEIKAWRWRRRGEGGEVRLRPLEHTEERGRCRRRVPY